MAAQDWLGDKELFRGPAVIEDIRQNRKFFKPLGIHLRPFLNAMKRSTNCATASFSLSVR